MKIITFGEVMMRLMPPGYGRLIQSDSFGVTYAGAEANVAVSLSQFGCEAAFVSKFPENALGDAAENSLRRYGVDTRGILRGGERLGIYFLEKGANQRPSRVVYDRRHSAIAEAAPGEYDWKSLLRGADWLHLSGITPALSDGCAAAALEACRTARALGVRVSFDVNFRSTLWSAEKAGEVLTPIVENTDLLIANEEHCRVLFGLTSDVPTENDEISAAACESLARKVSARFGCRDVAITLRRTASSSDNSIAALLLHDGEAVLSPVYRIADIVDRVGGGDALTAGLIYRLGAGDNAADAVEFAVAASALKHSVEGDFNLCSEKEVRALLKNRSGRTVR